MFGLFESGDAVRLARIEHKLDLILKHLGIACASGDCGLPPEARERADAGDTIGAIAAYRAATGAGLAEAKRAIDGYAAHTRKES